MAKSMLIILALLGLLVAWYALAATNTCDDIPAGKSQDACYIIQEGGNV
jgi:hypothetical protein